MAKKWSGRIRTGSGRILNKLCSSIVICNSADPDPKEKFTTQKSTFAKILNHSSKMLQKVSIIFVLKVGTGTDIVRRTSFKTFTKKIMFLGTVVC